MDAIREANSMTDEDWINSWIDSYWILSDTPYIPKESFILYMQCNIFKEAEKFFAKEAA